MGSTFEEDLVVWAQSPLGGYLLDHEMRMLSTRLPRLPGSSLLWLGYPGRGFSAQLCMQRERTLILNDAVLAKSELGERFGSYLCASVTALPLASASQHAIVVQHAFDQSRDVHEAVRESARVMCLGGQIIILGFNPYSAWGLRRRVCGHFDDAPWRGRLVSLGRMQDWLQLLGFRILETGYSVYRLPFGAPRVPSQRATRTDGLPVGGIYVLHARKEGPTFNVIRPSRQVARPRLVPATVAGRISAAVPHGAPAAGSTVEGDGAAPAR